MPETNPTTYRWLRCGAEAFPAMLEAVEAARGSVRLEMYILRASPLADQFRDALVAAARRGVRVQVLLDALGCFSLAAGYWTPLIEAGGQFRWFNPLRVGRMIYRNHRKLLVCDDRRAFVGGINISPEYEGDGVTRGWLDLGMELQGGVVPDLAASFDDMFAAAEMPFRLLPRLRRAKARRTSAAESWRLLLGGPGRGTNFLKATLAQDLAAARDVRIVCAYFLPTWRIRRELERIPRRGGRVQLVLAGKSDIGLSRRAGQRLYAPLLRKGVEIAEYQPQVLHAKLFLVDDQVYVGSANLDARSLNINYELLVRVSDPGAVGEARELFDGILAQSRPIRAAAWGRSRSCWTKLLENWAYFVLARLDPYVARRNLDTLQS
ncbi:MAG: hypothetical protein RJA22_1200 [Verrucomicrobiota bacterium]